MPHPVSPDRSFPAISPWPGITTNLKTDFCSVGTTECNCFSEVMKSLAMYNMSLLFLTGYSCESTCTQFILLLLEIYRGKKHSLCLPRSSGGCPVSCVFLELQTLVPVLCACVCSWPLQSPCVVTLGPV